MRILKVTTHISFIESFVSKHSLSVYNELLKIKGLVSHHTGQVQNEVDQVRVNSLFKGSHDSPEHYEDINVFY